MKKIILGITFAISSILASTVDVEVRNIANKNGKIVIGLYNKDDNTFADVSKFYKSVTLDVYGTKVAYKFKDIPNGAYAIAVFHDENGNGKLDKNFLGIPKEGYGFSNNIRPKLRGATFKESRFVLNGDKKIVIKLGY